MDLSIDKIPDEPEEADSEECLDDTKESVDTDSDVTRTDENAGKVKRVLLHGNPEEQKLLEIKLLELALDERKKTLNTNTEKAKRIERFLREEADILEDLTFEFQVKSSEYTPTGGPASATTRPAQKSASFRRYPPKSAQTHRQFSNPFGNTLDYRVTSSAAETPVPVTDAKSRCSTASLPRFPWLRQKDNIRFPLVKVEKRKFQERDRDFRLTQLEKSMMGKSRVQTNFLLCCNRVTLHSRYPEKY